MSRFDDSLPSFDDWLTALDRSLRPLAGSSSSALRVGLGVTIFLAGAHKLVAPATWHVYLAPAFEAVWPTGILALDPAFVLFGVSEVLFGTLILTDWHTPTIAILTALSLLGVVVNLAIAIGQGQPFVDVLVRDIGLTVLAAGVALDAARAPDSDR